MRGNSLALPVSFHDCHITYDVPMGAVTVGKDEVKGDCATKFLRESMLSDIRQIAGKSIQEKYKIDCGSMDDESHVVLSSDVSMFDYKNVKDDSDKTPIIQPILLASGRSCHGWGK